MKNKIFARFDYFLLIIVSVLVSMGVLFIYSSSINSEGVSVTNEYTKQIIWAVVGLFFMILMTFYDYRKLESLSLYMFLIYLFLLIIVLIPFIGHKVNGARSWLGFGSIGFQPSEIGKIFYILFLARYFDESRGQSEFKRFIIGACIMCAPMMLILLQPDMGTASVYLPIFIIMCFIADIPPRYWGYVLAFGLLTIFFAILPVWNLEIAKTPLPVISILTRTKFRTILIAITAFIAIVGLIVRKYFHAPKYVLWISYVFSIISLSVACSIILGKLLKYYQIKRLIVFLDPNTDPRGAGWNIIQSKIAIGAGGIFGRGYLGGTQSHLRFLPQQSTDFIFSILSEELGFIGGLIVFILYFCILVRILLIMRKCPNKFGLYISAGIFAMFSFHFFINVGMVMGIMPITGIPLLFLSYGGSSLLTAMLSIGLLMNINFKKKEMLE